MKRILINAVKRASGLNERDARERVAETASNYHDRLNRHEVVLMRREMKIDLELEYVDSELQAAMEDEVKNIRTERDELLPILDKLSSVYCTDRYTMKDLMIMSFDKEKRDEFEVLGDIYFYVSKFRVESIKNA